MSETGPFSLDPYVVDYAQRADADPFAAVGPGEVTAAPPSLRAPLVIRGVGLQGRTTDRQPAERPKDTPAHPQAEQVLIGLYRQAVPFGFQVISAGGQVQFVMSAWASASSGAAPADVCKSREVVESLLRGAYPSADAMHATSAPPHPWPRSGLALGVPTFQPGEASDRALPIQRLIRAMAGKAWSLLVLAEPARRDVADGVRNRVLNDMRQAAAAQAVSGVPSPLADHYQKVLAFRLKSLSEGQSLGLWRTAVYLLGDEDSFSALASAFCAVLSGSEPFSEPLRVFDGNQAGRWAAQWALPEHAGAKGPTSLADPYAAETLLTSRQLAALAHLPDQELPGFEVREEPVFDTAKVLTGAGDRVRLGMVAHGSQVTKVPYELEVKTLGRHALIAGITGAGKTNTVLGLLSELADRNVPFLVIEPAKSEYRSLLQSGRFGERVLVFTPGDETIAPFRLNPFDVEQDVPLGPHLDLLRAAFSASFGMWTPLPQVLEQCLYEIYADTGWNLLTGRNRRLTDGAVSPLAFPTLSDLVQKVPQVTHRLGYDEKVEADIQAALISRLQSLLVGGKGAMLDTATSLPMDVVLGQPTVIELERLGDDDDKALLMGLLLARLAEYRRRAGAAAELVHVTVIEEAHRLLARTAPQTSEENADPRGHAVETFVNLLAEIRAYGEGIIIADQIPMRLAPEAIKNTNLKIAHQTVSSDDREALAGAMAMDPAQTRALASLPKGRAAVFSGADETPDEMPVLVQLRLVKDELTDQRPDDDAVADRMRAWRSRSGLEALFLARAYCAETCGEDLDACQAGRLLLADRSIQKTLSRTILSTIEDPHALDRLWNDIVESVRVRQPPGLQFDHLMRSFLAHAADWLIARRGAQAGWNYELTRRLAELLRNALLARLRQPVAAADGEIILFCDAIRAAYQRDVAPFPFCAQVCKQEPPVCLYRHAVADLVESGTFDTAWRTADETDAESDDNRRRATWATCQLAGYELIEFPEEDWPTAAWQEATSAAVRTCLCFEQQMLAADASKLPRTARRVMTRVIAEAESQ